MQKYGQKTPPTYDITKIPKNVKIFLAAGTGDLLADTTDVNDLEKILKDSGND